MFRKLSLNFQWRLLIPTLGGMWLVIAILAFYQFTREEHLRKRAIELHLEMMTSNVIDAYQSHLDMPRYIEFIRHYYTNTNYAGVRVSVYDYNGNLIHAAGDPLPFEYRDYATLSGDQAPVSMLEEMNGDTSATTGRLFYYMTQKSNDGKIYVLTAMPLTVSISSVLSGIYNIIYVTVAIAILASLFIVLYVNHISKSVRLLAQFARNAEMGIRPQTDYDFPDDEIGDISRHIIALYREKDNALADREREHQVALNAIKEKARFKREMTNNINHELKTPVGIIKGYVDTMMAQPDMDPATTRHFLERTQQSIDRLSQLLTDVSTLTRLDDGLTQVAIGPVNFHDVLFHIDDEMRLSGLLGNMKFSYDVPLDTIVTSNLRLLQGAIYNLIRNAIRYSQGTIIRIEQTGESDTFYSFRFYDDGIGVPEEAIPNLFDRFYCVDRGRSRKSSGTGLGLTIVHRTITQLGGAISVKNRSTGGLEFTFTLRRAHEDQPTETIDTDAPIV